MSELPLISVCIPAYNRAKLLPVLLQSILSQSYPSYEIVICEDMSPEREKIREVALQYYESYPNVVKYHENENNLGYDGNLRRLIELAKGEYVLFMGNDDLLAEDALIAIAVVVKKYPNIGVVLRSYDSFEQNEKDPVQVFRYFDDERFFNSGADTIATFFRRCVFISGMVFKRDSALRCSTERFDGTLLYQQHLTGHILALENGVYIPQVLSHHRLGGVPDFGNSHLEKGRFVPHEQTPDSSIFFMSGMLKIAFDLEKELKLKVYKLILRDIGNYSYPILSIQANQSRIIFIKYICNLAKLGLWRIPIFYVYVLGLLFLGKKFCDSIIIKIKNKLGRAPVIGKVYSGNR